MTVLVALTLVTACSPAQPTNRASGQQTEPAKVSASPSASAKDLSRPLQRLVGSPCAIVHEEDAPRLGVTVGPRQLNGLYGGTRSLCYWVTSTGIQFGWIPDPPDRVRQETAREPGSLKTKVAGYPVWQGSENADSCTQDVMVAPDHYFRTVVNRVEKPKGVKTAPVCQIASGISELFVTTLAAIA